MQNADLTEKIKHYKFKKIKNTYKNGKNNYKIFVILKSKKQKFRQYKRSISIKNINTNKIVVSNKASFGKTGFKCFIGYKDAKKIKFLWIFFPKTIAYRKDFGETK